MTSAEHIGFQDKAEEKIPLILSRGTADFIHVLAAPSGTPFPTGFTGKILLYLSQTAAVAAPDAPLATWNPTTVSTTQLIWNIQHGTATGPDAMITAGAGWYRLYVNFPVVPTDDYLWYFGPVKYRG